MKDGTYTGVVDRIVDGETAVVLLEADDDVRAELDVPAERLPEAGRHEGAVFDVAVEEGDASEFIHRPEAERERRERAQERFDRLSKRLDEE